VCEKQAKSGWREMSGIVGEIDSQVDSMCHVTNGAVGRGAHGGQSPL